VEEFDRRNGSFDASGRQPCCSDALAAWMKSGDHAGPVVTRGDSDGRTGGPWREYRLLRLGSREIYTGRSVNAAYDPVPGEGKLLGVLLRVTRSGVTKPEEGPEHVLSS
jgi:hypothetical protein